MAGVVASLIMFMANIIVAFTFMNGFRNKSPQCLGLLYLFFLACFVALGGLASQYLCLNKVDMAPSSLFSAGFVVLLSWFYANKVPNKLGLRVDKWFAVVSSQSNQVHNDSWGGTCECNLKTLFNKSFWDGSPRHNPFTFPSNPPCTCGVSVPCCWTEPEAHTNKLRSLRIFLAKSCSKGKKQTTWVFSMGNESLSPSACCWYSSNAYPLKTKRIMKEELVQRAHKENVDGRRLIEDEETRFKTVRHPRKFTITSYSHCLCLRFTLCSNLIGIVLAIVPLIMDL